MFTSNHSLTHVLVDIIYAVVVYLMFELHSFFSLHDLVSDVAGYLPNDVIEAGLKSGRFVQGRINVNKHNPQNEAFLTPTGYVSNVSHTTAGWVGVGTYKYRCNTHHRLLLYTFIAIVGNEFAVASTR